MKRFYFKFNLLAQIAFYALCAVTLAGAVFNILRIAGVIDVPSVYIVLDSVAVAISLGLFGLMLYLFTSAYVFKKDELYIRFAFTRKSLKYSEILAVAQEEGKPMLVLYFRDETAEDGVSCIAVCIYAAKTEKFINALKQNVPDVQVTKA